LWSYPDRSTPVEFRCVPKLVLRRADINPRPAILRHHLELAHRPCDVLLSDSEKAADADDQAFDLAIAFDEDVLNLADRTVGP
jgi:hypothetical protein